MAERIACTPAVHSMEARADRKGCCTTRTPHIRCRAPCHNPILRLSTAQVMFVSRNPLHVIRIPLSASDGSCSTHPNDGDARAHHKECCTPRLPRVHVKSIARINGPTNICQPGKLEDADGEYERTAWTRDLVRLIMLEPFFESNYRKLWRSAETS